MLKNTIQVAKWTGILLLIPIALQLTIGTGVDGQGWNWKLGDFIFAALFIFIAGMVLSTIWRKTSKNRAIAIILAILVFVWLWAEAAVGIFTNWGS